MTHTPRKTAIEYIQSLNEKELVDFFYEAVTDRNEDKEFEDGYERDRECIISTSFGKFEGEEDEEHYSTFQALPVPEIADLDWIKNEKHICQSGRCNRCKAIVLSVAKLALCPVCDAEVECT